MRLILLALTIVIVTLSPQAFAQTTCGGKCSACVPKAECERCREHFTEVYQATRRHVTEQFIEHREKIVKEFFEQNLLPALMLMTEQMTTVALQQTQIIGTFFDARHQMETQRLFQQLQAQAHKDYHPSEGLCQFGTSTRSLTIADRITELNTLAISSRNMQRQLRTGDIVSVEAESSDKASRLDQFKKTYCNPADNGNGLDTLCGAGGPADRRNKDVNFTRTLEGPMTLELDFSPEARRVTPDEEDIFALGANLFSSQVPASIPELNNGQREAALKLLDYRSIAAKRSVAQNSFAAIAAMKSQSAPEVTQYMKEVLKELGIPEADINVMLRERPSYFAQMEILTKKIYQNPAFYTELYDKPANVERKRVALQAIGLMQKRDMYRSLLRSEATLSVLLEAELLREQDRIANEDVPR